MTILSQGTGPALAASTSLPFAALPGGGKRLGLLIEPLDAFFCRDGRPFSDGSVVLGGLPYPQVVAGALRTYALQQVHAPLANIPNTLAGEASVQARERGRTAFEKWQEELRQSAAAWILGMRSRGPWLCKVTNGTPDVHIPMPADVVHEKGDPSTFIRLKPLRPGEPMPGWNHDKVLRPLWHDSGKGCKPAELKSADGYLSRDGWETYLKGGRPAETIKAGELFDYEHRTGIQVEPDRLAADEGMIYSIRMVRLKLAVALYAELDLLSGRPPDDQLARVFPSDGWVIRLGGEGKLARVRPVAPQFPVVGSTSVTGGRDLLLLITPAAFDDPYWRPNFAAWNRKLIAAAVPGYVAISGWDLAQRCPKPTRHFVTAGSVYFLEAGGDPVPETLSASKDTPGRHGPNDALQGYGICLKGTWDYG